MERAGTECADTLTSSEVKRFAGIKAKIAVLKRGTILRLGVRHANQTRKRNDRRSRKGAALYRDVLGFAKKADIPMGTFRWLTVTSPQGAEGVELVLEPMNFPPAKVYQKALFDAGIPATAFLTNDIYSEFARLTSKGVMFRGEPANMGSITAVVFEDTCGNLINLVQPKI